MVVIERNDGGIRVVFERRMCVKRVRMPELSRRGWMWTAGAAGTAALIFLAISFFRPGEPEGMRWVVAGKGEFVIELVESGDVAAASSRDVKAPLEGNDLQIIEMVPEGTVVKAGDFLVQFDPVSLEKDLVTRRESLATSEAELKALDTEQERNLAAMESNLSGSQYSRELAEIKRERMKFESPVKQRQTEIEYQQQMLALDEDATRLQNQKVIDAAARFKVFQQVEENRARVQRIEQRIKEMTLYAPIGGLVVYAEIGGRRGVPLHKVAVGDKPWPSQTVISIPGATDMQVALRVNEVDAGKLVIGDRADIRLDAFEGARYTGVVSRVAKLADRRDSDSELKDFEVLVTVDKPDAMLKPGMTAQVRIALSRLRDVVSIPIGAVFEDRDGKPVVFTGKSGGKPVPVILGKRNDRSIIVAEGVRPGERVSLAPPEGAEVYPLGRGRDRALRMQELQRLKELPVPPRAGDGGDSVGQGVPPTDGKRERNGGKPPNTTGSGERPVRGEQRPAGR